MTSYLTVIDIISLSFLLRFRTFRGSTLGSISISLSETDWTRVSSGYPLQQKTTLYEFLFDENNHFVISIEMSVFQKRCEAFISSGQYISTRAECGRDMELVDVCSLKLCVGTLSMVPSGIWDE